MEYPGIICGSGIVCEAVDYDKNSHHFSFSLAKKRT